MSTKNIASVTNNGKRKSRTTRPTHPKKRRTSRRESTPATKPLFTPWIHLPSPFPKIRECRKIRDIPEDIALMQTKTKDFRERRVYPSPKDFLNFEQQCLMELKLQNEYKAQQEPHIRDFLQEQVEQTHMFQGRGTRKLRFGCDWEGIPNVQQWKDKMFSDHKRLPGPTTAQAIRFMAILSQLFPHTRLSIHEAFAYFFEINIPFTRAFANHNRYAKSTIKQYTSQVKKLCHH